MGGDALAYVLECIWHEPATTKSNFSREFADEIAEAASRGLITTCISVTPPAPYGRVWRITDRGLRFLKRARKECLNV